jgi:hypothetical protein
MAPREVRSGAAPNDKKPNGGATHVAPPFEQS